MFQVHENREDLFLCIVAVQIKTNLLTVTVPVTNYLREIRSLSDAITEILVSSCK